MPEVREEDERDEMPIPLKNVSPAVPEKESELEELIDDLRRMGCEGLLQKPWNVRSESTLREFKYERGNQWERTLRQDPEKWTAEVWGRVYGFALRKGEGWAHRKDSFYVGKFRGEHDSKDGFHPANCRNDRERRVIEFILPILSPEKPKRLTITMANTLFGAISGLRPVNWGRLIQEYVERNIPFIGRKPSFLSPYILHLYKHYECLTGAEEDALQIAEDEAAYKLAPEVTLGESGSEESSEGPAALEPALPDPVPAPTLVSAHVPETRRAPTPQPQVGGVPTREQPWRNVNPATWEPPEFPFERVKADVTTLQNEYWRLEHIVRGASKALGNCSAGNILRELAKRTDRSKVETLENEKAQLTAQVEAMTKELTQKSEEIRRYKAEQTVVLSKVRELVGQPGEVVNKAHLYDQLLESADPASARQTLQILVKYSRTMKDLLAEIRKILPPRGTPRRILDPGPPGSPTATLYEAIAEVEIVPAAQASAEPNQPAGTSGMQESGKVPERQPIPVPEPTPPLRCAGRARSGPPGPVVVSLQV